MANVGLKMLTVALFDDKTGKIITGEDGLSETGILEIDNRYFGSTQANMTNLEGSINKVSGNNMVQWSYVNPAAPQIDVIVNNLAADIKNKMLGRKSDGKGGYVFTGNKPTVGLLVNTQTIDRSADIYFGFRRTNMSSASVNVGTDTDQAITLTTDSLTFTALGVPEWNDGQPFKDWISNAADFDKEAMLADVFPGYAGSDTTTTTTSK